MGEEITRSRFSKRDFSRFKQALEEETALLKQWLSVGRFSQQANVVGSELEVWLVDQQCRPAAINEPYIKLSNNPMIVPELSQFNIEINCHQRTLKGRVLQQLHAELDQTWLRCTETATQLQVSALMIGILPTVTEAELTLANMSQQERYRALNEQILRQRKGQPMHLDIKGADHLRISHADLMLEAGATSFQIHLQVDPQRAARFYNAAHIISAPMVAATANSPYLFGKDLWDETRIPLFEQAVAVEGYEQSPCGPVRRVTFGTGYVKESLFECFMENLECHPVLLPVPLEEDPAHLSHVRLHNGTIWRWNRPLIGFDSDGTPHLRIEHRVVPAGPSVIDASANIALFCGLIQALATQAQIPETLIEFDQARSNFYNAARQGLRASLVWFAGREVLAQPLLLDELIPLARSGLQQLNLANADIELYMGIIEQRVRSGQNGAAWQRAYVDKHGRNMQALTAAYLERQCSGEPVHQWSIA